MSRRQRHLLNPARVQPDALLLETCLTDEETEAPRAGVPRPESSALSPENRLPGAFGGQFREDGGSPFPWALMGRPPRGLGFGKRPGP